jgi:hypothetical protein
MITAHRNKRMTFIVGARKRHTDWVKSVVATCSITLAGMQQLLASQQELAGVQGIGASTCKKRYALHE